MNKTFKKIAASIMAVTSLAVSMVGMSANAADWAVRDIKGAPGSVNVHEHYDAKVASQNVTSTSESCTLAMYCMSASGQSSRARYHGYYEYTSDGRLYKMITFNSRYHTVDTVSQVISFIHTVPKGCTYYTGYHLEFYDAGSCNYNGTIG